MTECVRSFESTHKDVECRKYHVEGNRFDKMQKLPAGMRTCCFCQGFSNVAWNEYRQADNGERKISLPNSRNHFRENDERYSKIGPAICKEELANNQNGHPKTMTCD